MFVAALLDHLVEQKLAEYPGLSGSLLDQARRSSQVLDEMGKSLRDNMRRLAPHRLGAFQRAARSAQENLLDLRAAIALYLEDDAELDDLGWTAPEDPPLGTRGPMRSLEDLRREHGW